jgi:AcrR family transcriptional regulator
VRGRVPETPARRQYHCEVAAAPEPAEELSSGPAAVRRRIIAAAVVEFSIRGLAATTMADIAARAGIRRQNLYRYVRDKDELLSQVLIEQVRDVHAARKDDQVLSGPVGPIIVAALQREHSLARDDELLKLARSTEVAADTAKHLRTDDALFVATREFWQPVLDYGRERGELRDDINDHDIIRWFFLVQYMLIINEPIFRDPGEIAHFLRRMVAAAVLCDPGSV